MSTGVFRLIEENKPPQTGFHRVLKDFKQLESKNTASEKPQQLTVQEPGRFLSCRKSSRWD